MSNDFFYQMNKKLQQVVEMPKSEHKQLNERDEGKHNNATTGFKALAAKAAGERVAGAVRNKMKKAGKLEEGDMEESAFQAAIGKKKYGADGMKALQKAGRDHASAKTMSNIRNKYDKYDESMEEGMFDSLKAGMAKAGAVAKKVGGKALDTLGHGSDEQMRKDLQKKMGVPQTGKKPVGEEYGPLESEGGVPMTPKQKKFAKLAPPADKIAGAKKEVDEVLGDVAANAMRKAVSGHGTNKKKSADEGSDWSQLGKEYSRPKIGSVERGTKHDIEHTATGRRVTRRTDDQGMSVGADDEQGASPEKRGRGRPKGSGKSIGAKGPSGKSKLMKRESEQELDEKAVSKKQQKFMGMVHAAQKGEKPASKEVAKVAKTMKKKDAEDFAATKHKGLPEKVKSKKKEKTEEAGGTDTPTASSGFSYGKGIYDSLNREIENLISESMSINASDSTDGNKTLTITATDDDAVKLAEIVHNAGLGGEAGHEEPHGEVEVVGVDSPISGDEGACDTCGSHDCGCGDIEEALDENQPDWPTDEVESDDALQYSGGLNGPKSTGQTTVPVIANQGDRTGVDDEALRRLREMAGLAVTEQEQVMAPESIEEAKEICEVCEATPCKCNESVEESIAALRGLAGIQEAAKPDFADIDNDGNEDETAKKAAADKEAAEEKKVSESIFRMSNLWKSYKG